MDRSSSYGLVGSVRLLGGSFGSSPVSGTGGEVKAKDTVLRKSRMVKPPIRGTAGAQLGVHHMH